MKVTVGFELECCIDEQHCENRYYEAEEELRCENCDGSGFLYMGSLETEVDCPFCDGRGYRYVYYEERDEDSAELPQLETTFCEEVVTDCSIKPPEYYLCGAEIRSAVLQDEQELIEAPEEIIEELSALGLVAAGDNCCGLHVHVRPKGGWVVETLHTLANVWSSYGEMYFVDEFGISDDRRSYTQCGLWNSCNVPFERVKEVVGASVYEYANAFGNYNRYATLNYHALFKPQKTVEFRLFDSTDNPRLITKALQWVQYLTESCMENKYDVEAAWKSFLNKIQPERVTLSENEVEEVVASIDALFEETA